VRSRDLEGVQERPSVDIGSAWIASASSLPTLFDRLPPLRCVRCPERHARHTEVARRSMTKWHGDGENVFGKLQPEAGIATVRLLTIWPSTPPSRGRMSAELSRASASGAGPNFPWVEALGGVPFRQTCPRLNRHCRRPVYGGAVIFLFFVRGWRYTELFEHGTNYTISRLWVRSLPWPDPTQ